MTKRIAIFAASLFAGLSANASLIISQYYEGPSNNKWIEIYNPDGTDVDLTAGDFRLGLWSNANREGWKTSVAPNSTAALSGSLASGATLLLRHTSAVLPTYATGTAHGAVNFNGDDSIVLYTGSTFAFSSVVDVFGATANSFVDRSYTRNDSVITGVNTDFNAADWTEHTLAAVEGAATDTLERLGFHSANVVPEPTTAGLLALGLLVLRRVRRR